jgi:hypothetical protein
MTHMRTYPIERQLKELAYNVPFPMPCGEMLTVAKYMGCAPATLRLLGRFNPDDTFENGVDFVNRCEETRLFEHEEHLALKELLRSPQG